VRGKNSHVIIQPEETTGSKQARQDAARKKLYRMLGREAAEELLRLAQKPKPDNR
jgi:hypothetical protein